MQSTLDAVIALPTVDPSPPSPHTIVLQPSGTLDDVTSAAFQDTLEAALHEARDAVIVDLLWVEAADEQGIAALVAGIECAAKFGKAISFQSMDISTRKALEVALNRQRDRYFGPRRSYFEAGLEQFLDHLAQ